MNYTPMYNPIQPQQFAQPFQAPQPTQFQPPALAVPSIGGRFVQNEGEIAARDVSMGGAPSLFPLADGSAIFSKQWANDGTIHTVRYVPEAMPEQAPELTLADVMAAVEALREEVGSIGKAKRPMRKAEQTKLELDDAE